MSICDQSIIPLSKYPQGTYNLCLRNYLDIGQIFSFWGGTMRQNATVRDKIEEYILTKYLKILFGLALLFAVACGPVESTPETITTDTGLQYEELEAGTGPAPEAGDVVAVHYTGTLADGTEFDSSYARGEPYQFVLGVGEVIPGWDEGVALMQEGGKAVLTIPPELAYGSTGAGNLIPPDATLTFEVELVEVSGPPPTSTPPPPPTSVEEGDYTVTDSGLKYAVLESGSGDPPTPGQIATLHFAGWLEDGTSIGDSRTFGQPVPVTVGAEEVMPGWDEALALMQPGEVAQFVMPPDLALGEEGSGSLIPPNSTLIFEFELVSVEDPPPTPTPAPPPTSLDDAEYTETESGLRYAILSEGDGETPQPGQTVVIDYRGWLEDGTQFDSSYDRGQPLPFVLGQEGIIAGMDEGVSLMKVGDTAQFVIPPELGYGEQGSGGVIPPNTTLIFEVELLEIQESGE